MHAALSALERKVEEEGRAFPDRPGERQQAYALVESLDSQLAETRALLAETLGGGGPLGGGGLLGAGSLGGGGGGALAAHAGSGPLQGLVHVLDVHLNAFEYLERSSKKLDMQLAEADRLLAQPFSALGSMPY